MGLADKFRKTSGQVDENGFIRHSGTTHGRKPPPPPKTTSADHGKKPPPPPVRKK